MAEVPQNGSETKTTQDEQLKIESPETQQPEDKGREVTGPTVGIDAEGYFFVKAHLSAGFPTIFWWLHESGDWLKKKLKDVAGNQKIIKPEPTWKNPMRLFKP